MSRDAHSDPASSAASIASATAALSPTRTALRRLWRIAFVAAGVALLGWASGVRAYRLSGNSMLPRVLSGDYFFGLTGVWNLRDPGRFDLAIFDLPARSQWAAAKIPWMRRVVGLPGEHLRLTGAELYIDGRRVAAPFLQTRLPPAARNTVELTLGADEYFLVGDNLDESLDDSRTFGPVERRLIFGHAVALGADPVRPPPHHVSDALILTVNAGWHLFLYFATAGAAYLFFHVLRRRFYAARRIQPRPAGGRAIRRDILYSLSSVAIFALVGLAVHHLTRAGWTKLYVQIDRYGWPYFWFSLLLLIVVHDTWFYWTHRAMHWSPLFRIMHRVHHLSHTPTPWSALAFHPTEAVVQAIVFPLMALVVPIHPFVGGLWLIYMIVINVWGHLGIELLPAGFRQHWLFRWHNTTTHHDMHHRHITGNYSLYFNFWDRIMKTNRRDY